MASHGTNKSCGVIVLFCPCFSLVKSGPNTSGRSLMADFKCSDFVFRVCSLYAPNRNAYRDDFLIECADLVDPSVPTLLCGYFNTIFDRLADRRGSCPWDNLQESTSALSSMFSECCVSDI